MLECLHNDVHAQIGQLFLSAFQGNSTLIISRHDEGEFALDFRDERGACKTVVRQSIVQALAACVGVEKIVLFRCWACLTEVPESQMTVNGACKKCNSERIGKINRLRRARQRLEKKPRVR